MLAKRTQLRTMGGIITILIAAALLFGSGSMTADSAAADFADGMDHSFIPDLHADFETGPEVTAVCLTCHADAGDGIIMSTHWTWEYETNMGQTMGKNNIINNYCVAVASNYPRCTSCHIGYGYANEDFDFENPANVDCLVCHDTTGTYRKFPAGAGRVVNDDDIWGGNEMADVDLSLVAQSVGTPTRSNCGTCHFYGGGGAGVKHGDLDPSMANPSYELDVHMSPDGGDFACQECHLTGADHNTAGSLADFDLTGEGPMMACIECHTEGNEYGGPVMHVDTPELNEHIDRVACQTCHIPAIAREFPTMTHWDWSTAGDTAGGSVSHEIFGEEFGSYSYHPFKGTFVWDINFQPEYMWFNGDTWFYEIGDEMDPSVVTELNTLMGDINDSSAMIFPVKAMEGIQGYDAGTNILAVPQLFGPPDDPNAYWRVWDWNLSFGAGMAAVGLEYSGEYGWTETVMYWPITHQTAPAADAVQCVECHTEEGRLDYEALGYDAEMAANLSVFPPVVEEEVVEEPVVEEPVEEAVEEDTAEEAVVEEPVVEEEAGGLDTIWIIASVLLVIGAGAYTVLRKKE